MKIKEECKTEYKTDFTLDDKSSGSKSNVIIKNTKKTAIIKVRIDGCAITEGKRCDFLLLTGDQEIYIELKGNSEFSKAFEQIEATIKVLSSNVKECPKICLVVFYSVPKLVSSKKQRITKKFRRDYKAQALIKSTGFILRI